MSNKLTDNEIVKALECCTSNRGGDCNKCYFRLRERKSSIFCVNELICSSLDLINRLQADCENYKALYEGLKAEHIETIKAIKHYKAEAYKEFAERLKEEQYLSIVAMVVSVEAIDNLLKELAGE